MRVPDKTNAPVVSGALFNELRDVVQYLLTNAIVTVAPPLEVIPVGIGRAVALGATGSRVFYAKITDYDQVNSTTDINRYVYGWEEVRKDTGGYATTAWVTPGNGKSGTTSANPARNTIEVMNGTTGVLGNGVDADGLVGTFALQPAPVGVIVVMTEVVLTDGSREYWFEYSNGVDGDCP